jgi:hypothetical protein
MALCERQAEVVGFALGEMKPGFGVVIGSKSRDLDKLLNPQLGAGLEKRPRSNDVNGFKAVGPITLKDAGRVDDRVNTLEALPPILRTISGEIASNRFQGREHEAKSRSVSPAGDDLVSGLDGLNDDVPSDESAGTDDQNPHGVNSVASGLLARPECKDRLHFMLLPHCRRRPSPDGFRRAVESHIWGTPRRCHAKE